MRAKKLGRHDLLSWINTQTQSDYPKIENLSDGVAFCQILDCYYPNAVSLNTLKLNSKNEEDWERNLSIVNELLLKIKSFKQIDPSKLCKSKFTPNFEFLQFIYDLIAKSFNDSTSKISAYEKRLEIVKSQNGNKIKDIKKYLPTHLIPNDLILRMDRQRFFGGEETKNDKSSTLQATNKFEAENQRVLKIDLFQDSKVEEVVNSQNSFILPIETLSVVKKYEDFLSILKDDLQKKMDKNFSIIEEIKDIEEEREYYLEKIHKVLLFCENFNSGKNKPETVKIMNDIVKIIKQVPEDFK
jgi:hypothetical protein